MASCILKFSLYLQLNNLKTICNMNSILFRYNPWWENEFTPSFFERKEITDSLINNLSSKQIIVLLGMRRVGKTSILKLMIQKLIEMSIEPKHILYLSLDEYLLKDNNIHEIVDHFRQLMKLEFSEKIYLFFDEVTYQKDFEIQIKNLYDSHNVKIFISSSNSMVLEDKKALLTGRTFNMEILPLNFAEYLDFKNIRLKQSENHLVRTYFDEYLKTGGIPEYVINNNFVYLKNLVDDIIYKDIAAIHNIKDIKILKDMFLLLMERSGKQVSINKIANILLISPDTAKRYFNYFERTFLIHLISRKGTTNERIRSAKKVYAGDIGIRNYYTGYRDIGSIFENYVYLKIKHLSPEYIYQNTEEIDFYTEDKRLVEAKYHDEELSKKQQILFDKTIANKKYIIRNEQDIINFLSE